MPKSKKHKSNAAPSIDDPVLALFTEWKQLWWAHERLPGGKFESVADAYRREALDRRIAVEHVIAKTPATSLEGIAAKLVVADADDDPFADIWRSAAADARRLANLPGRRSDWPPAWVDRPQKTKAAKTAPRAPARRRRIARPRSDS
jgi:hypothetical protein